MTFIKDFMIMIDFILPQYEWQKTMPIVFENVNLYDVSVSNVNGLLFKFLNSHNGKDCGALQCRNIWKSQFDAASSLDFPIFICDIRIQKLSTMETEHAFKFLKYGFGIPDVSDCYLVCMDSGEVSVILICGYVKILMPDLDS